MGDVKFDGLGGARFTLEMGDDVVVIEGALVLEK